MSSTNNSSKSPSQLDLFSYRIPKKTSLSTSDASLLVSKYAMSCPIPRKTSINVKSAGKMKPNTHGVKTNSKRKRRRSRRVKRNIPTVEANVQFVTHVQWDQIGTHVQVDGAESVGSNSSSNASSNAHEEAESEQQIEPDENQDANQDYKKIKMGRITGYPVSAKQGKYDYDAILLNCNQDPEKYLNDASNADETIKIRWLLADYNAVVPASSVALKKMEDKPPSRKAAEMSGLLEGAGKGTARTKEGLSTGVRSEFSASLDEPDKNVLMSNTLGTSETNLGEEGAKPCGLPHVRIKEEAIDTDDEYHCDTDDEMKPPFTSIFDMSLFKVETDDEFEDDADDQSISEQAAKISQDDDRPEADAKANETNPIHAPTETVDSNIYESHNMRRRYRNRMCSICEFQKPWSQFSRNQRSSRGRSRCKSCIKAVQYSRRELQGRAAKMERLLHLQMKAIERLSRKNQRLENKISRLQRNEID
ncbi:hypothetical protein ACHAWO_001830 [Cyclotella atomus]|uniref:Stc1 domain-containing protein n=1 Tax=Cyclotella atomus TaxID=382360 RepID=A0ABD3NB07_9STRA